MNLYQLTACEMLSKLKGVKVLFPSNAFKEFVVNFDETGKSVEEVNGSLLKYHIFGGKDLSKEFPELGNSALYCVTEVHMEEDIRKLIKAFEEVLN